MDIEKVFKLIDAGFTKDEIIKMSEPPAEPKEEPKPEEPKKEEPKPEEPKKADPAKDFKKEITDAIGEAFKDAYKPFEELYNNMSKLAGMPSINDVQPKGIEDIISDFFKGE